MYDKLLEIYKYNQEESIKNEKIFLRSKKNNFIHDASCNIKKTKVLDE